jgi:hypothetical protein
MMINDGAIRPRRSVALPGGGVGSLRSASPFLTHSFATLHAPCAICEEANASVFAKWKRQTMLMGEKEQKQSNKRLCC